MCVSNLTLTVAYLLKLPLVLWLPATFIKHLYLFPVSIFSKEKKDLQMAVSKYHYMHYYKHLSDYFRIFFKLLPLIKFHFYAQLLLICLLIHVRRYFTLAYTPYLPLSAHPTPQLVTPWRLYSPEASLHTIGPPLSPWHESTPPSVNPAQIIDAWIPYCL